ncbi:MAG: retropepsin-like aspartic protease [bacterium]|nr:retropepsin-like aspartic protease [bacterium]
MGRITEKLIVRNYVDVATKDKDQVRSVEVDAIVDTGATYVCIGKKDIETLGLRFHNTVNIKTANGPAKRKTFEGAQIELNGRTFVMEVMENDDDTPALIGYLLLEALDFVVDPKSQSVIGNPAHDGKWVADMYRLATEEIKSKN